MLGRLLGWFDDRLGASRFARSALNKVFPDNWSFMLGEIALYSFVVLLVTGVYLTFFFEPGSKEVVYHGAYKPLDGVKMSEAYRSTVRLSFDVRAGLVFRQIHHWAALVFLGAIVVHLCRIFFTGAFRRPREINWIVGMSLFVLAMANGFAGYSLPDDLLSGTGLRIGYSIALAVPVIGTWLAFLFFGGEFPAEAIISRLFIIHVLLVPAAIVGLLAIHLAVMWHQKHTQFPGPGRTEHNVVGTKLWPTYAARSLGLFAAVFAVLSALGGLAQINPIWLYGPFEPSAVSTAAQPDWYMGWLEGALRVFPPWRIHIFGYVVSELFWPGVLLPTVTFGLLFMWPFIERRVTRDRADHELCDRPRDRPVRTAIGVGALTFYVVLFIAGAQDIIAQHLSAPIASVTFSLRVALFVAPLLAAAFAWKMCHDLAAAAPLEAPGPSDWPPSPAPFPSAATVEPSKRPLPLGRLGAALGAVAAVVAAFVAGRRDRVTRIKVPDDDRPRRR